MPTATRLTVTSLEDRANPADFAADRVLVSVPAPPVLSAFDAVVGSPAVAEVEAVAPNLLAATLAPGVGVADAVAAINRLPGLTATPDHQLTPAATPNDARFSSQWAHTTMQSAAAWNVTTGTGSTIVAVIDSGVDLSHPDLAPNLWRNPGEVAGNRVDDDGNGFVDDVHGADFTANTGDPSDTGGHGTAVAGVIGAAGNNALGVTGVLWRTRVMPLKFMGPGGGYTSDAIEAIDYAVRNGAKVINTSWGGPIADPALAAAVDRARGAGAIVVSAAGNDGRNTDNAPFYPAAYSVAAANGVSVAATDSNDRLASYSNRGANSVTLAAPGEGLLTTAMGGGYDWQSGTSVAAPQVSGALALLWDKNPGWAYTQVIAKLKASVDAVPALAGQVQTGGRLNLAKLLDSPATTPLPTAPPPAPPTVPTAPPVPATPPVAPSPPATPAPTPVVASVTRAAFGGTRAGQFDRVTVTFSTPVDANTLTAGVTVTGPLGAVPVSAVVPASGSGNTRFTLLFRRPQAAVGVYTLTVGPAARAAGGGSVAAFTQNTTLGNATTQTTAPGPVQFPPRAARLLSEPRTIAPAVPVGTVTATTRRFTPWQFPVTAVEPGRADSVADG